VPLDPDIKAIPIGEAEILRDGEHVVLIAIGTLAHAALEAAQELAGHGISAAVVNARFVRPLDEERLLPLVRRCGALLTLEEHRGAGGFGSALLELLSKKSVVVPTRCLAVDEAPVEHGESLESLGLALPDIVAAALDLVGRKAGSGTAG
jgi:1-deoxy-D-xylulose-5-phosphate synthase